MSWDLGICHREADSLEIVKDGIIQPALESVGILEWFLYTTFGVSSVEVVFTRVATQIITCSGTCPEKFSAAVDRIFTRTEAKALYTEWEGDETKRPAVPEPFSQHSALGELLESFSVLMHAAESHTEMLNNPQVLDLAKRIVKLLQLDRPGKQSADSRMLITNGEARWYLDCYRRNMECLGRIRCKFCAQRSLFRLTIWQEPKLEAPQVYRIPGLLFDETVPDSVGIVICRGLVIGKMVYRTPACGCRRSERVNLRCAM